MNPRPYTIVTLAQYWMGRDAAYPEECTLAVRRNAIDLLGRANRLLVYAAADGVGPGIDRYTGNAVASGWRPGAINAALVRTSNAAQFSTHLSGCGLDLQDYPDRILARWCLRNLELLEEVGIYMEDPRWTAALDAHGAEVDWWVHWQSLAPGSGRRVYIPNSAPARAAALPEQLAA